MVIKRPRLFLLYEIEQKTLLTRITQVEYRCVLWRVGGGI